MSTDTSVPHPRLSGLDASETALFATLLREAPIGFALFDTDLRFKRANDMLASIHGVTVAELAGRRPADAVPGEPGALIESNARKVVAEMRPVLDVDLKIGDRHWAYSWFPARDAGGELSGVVLVAVDVTDRVLAETTLRRKEERYRSLVEASSQTVWVTSPNGEVVDDAPEWRSLTGQTHEEYASEGWLGAVHSEDRPRIEREWQSCVTADRIFEATYRVRNKAGGYRNYDVRAVPIRRDGEIVEWVGANTDVTGKREAEEMRGRLTEQLSAAALRTARLQQATSMLAEALTVNQVVSVITEVGRSAIGADRSAVALLDDDKVRLHTITPGGIPELPGPAREEIGVEDASVMSIAVRERRPFLAENPTSLRLQLRGEEIDAFVRRTDERAWVGLPLMAAGRALGALRFSFTRPREITDEERVFLEALAGQCALAVERATLFEREHKTAEALQRSLLPDRLPQLPPMRLAARYHPATRHVQVGGDWYDAFPLQDGRVAIAIGDVMGKGVKAAAGMGRVRNALRALALNDPRPATVLSGLDKLFDATEGLEQITTLAYAVIEPTTGEGVISNAGHLPPLVITPDGTPEVGGVEPGTPLGWPSDRHQATFSVPPGNTVVFYSDGLVENRRRGLDSGLEELVSIAAAAPSEVLADPEILVDFLVDRMLAGYDHDDDVTVLALHVPPKTA
jgi:PAS domain S-box-containing protein